MEPKVIKEAIKRIRGLPTTSRIRKELTDKFQLRVSEGELEEDLERMLEGGEIEERNTTIKGNKFKGYKILEKKEGGEEERGEERGEEEKIIDEIFS